MDEATAVRCVDEATGATSSYVGYSLKRGVQVESVAASTTWVADHLTGHPDRYAYRFKSWQIAGGNGQLAAELCEELATFLVVSALGTLDLGPLAVTGHWATGLRCGPLKPRMPRPRWAA